MTAFTMWVVVIHLVVGDAHVQVLPDPTVYGNLKTCMSVAESVRDASAGKLEAACQAVTLKGKYAS